MNLSHLIEALSNPAAYPYAVEKVEVRQTHISAVFLARDFVYKVKKPVNPGFLDFTTPEKRRHFCEEEVRLNRRLAPDVYLGVVAVVETQAGARFEGTGPAIDWAVKMQRLPDSATFGERIRRGEIAPEMVEALARRIAEFHRSAERSEQIAGFGSFEAVSRNILDIFAQAEPQVGTTVSRAVFDRLLFLTTARLEKLRPLIEQRARAGRTCDGHGDLHLDHVYAFPEKKPPGDLVIIDCIEFSPRFRFIDPVADMAFAGMDFAMHGRRDLAHVFAETYFQTSGDAEGKELLPLYTAYRSTVRGLVEGLKLAEQEVPSTERAAALVRSRAHWLLALAELEEPRRKPCLLLVAGLPGAGKSSLARGLAEQAGFFLIRSDVARKDLARRASQPDQGLYTPEWTERTYEECLRITEKVLFEGQRVLVDATFREEKKRHLFLTAALGWGVRALMLLCRASPESIRKRLASRRGDASDADWSVHLQLAGQWEEPGPDIRRVLRELPVDASKEEVLAEALQALRDLGLEL